MSADTLNEFEQNITTLTKGGISSLCAEKSKEVVLQILDIRKVSTSFQIVHSKAAYRVTISDGFTKLGVVFVNVAAEKIDNLKLKPFAVVKTISANVHKENSTLAIMITDFKPINTFVTETVGAPMDYQDYMQSGWKNPRGSTAIPPKYLKLARLTGENIFGSNSIKSKPFPPEPTEDSIGEFSFGFHSLEERKDEQEENQRPRNIKAEPTPKIQQVTSGRGNGPVGLLAQKVNKVVGPLAKKPIRAPVAYYAAPINESGQALAENRKIGELSQYDTSWVIRARVVTKSDVREWHNTKGTGKFFSVQLMDSAGGEIPGVFFNDMAAVYYDKVEEGHVYFFSKGSLKRDYNDRTGSAGNKIVFDRDSIIEETFDDGEIPFAKLKFTKIRDINGVGDVVDVVGIVQDVENLQDVSLKSGEIKTRRNICIFDDTMQAIQMTLWGRDAETFTAQPGDILVVKGAKVGDFQGKNLQKIFSTKLFFDMNKIPEAKALIEWRDKQDNLGAGVHFVGRDQMQTIHATPVSCIAEILNICANIDTSSTYTFAFDAYISRIWHERNLSYKACPIRACSKKVNPTEGAFWCEGCRKQYDMYAAKYIANVQVTDFSDMLRVLFYDEEGQQLFGLPASEVEQMREGNPVAFREFVKEIENTEYSFIVQAKYDGHNPAFPVKFMVKSISVLTPLAACNRSLKILEQQTSD